MPRKRNQRRKSKQLEAICKAIKDEKSHPSADQIYQKVLSVMPNISLGTVYRNLQKLVADDKLQVLTLGRTQRFDPNIERHEHFICEQCGRVYDFFVRDLAASLPRNGFKVTSHNLALYGTCNHCSE